MNTAANKRKLRAFRAKKKRFLASLRSRTTDELTEMLLDWRIHERLDLDDDDESAIHEELIRRGVELFEGEEVPIEELLAGCPDCEALGRKHLLH